MALRDDLLPLVSSVRSIAGQIGIRMHSVAIVSGSWSGDHTGDGTEDQTATAITEAGGHPPKVRWLNDEQIAVGQLAKGTVEIGPITPSFPGGGTDLATLVGAALTRGETIHLRITGPAHPDGALYRVIDIRADRAFRYMLKASPTSEV
jgi:hypothetical protein